MTTTEAPVVDTSDTPEVEPTAGARLATATQTARAALAGWWVWTGRPLSYAEAWRLSAVDRTRLPDGSPWWLLLAWRVSNWSDRPLLFALMVAFPAGLQGPLRWVAMRPTRRWGTYLLVALTAFGAYASTRGA